MALTTTDMIQIISILISTITSIVAIWISVRTLKQTNRITKEANRPYVCATLEYITVTTHKDIYFVIKNHGVTGATIDDICFSQAPDFLLGLDIFNNLKGTFIAPKQKISTCGNFDGQKDFSVTIKYSTTDGQWEETFFLSPLAIRNVLYTNSSSLSHPELPLAITNATRELIRSNF